MDYWMTRALYYEALYRIHSKGNNSDPFIADLIDLPINRTGEVPDGPESIPEYGCLFSVFERQRADDMR